MGPFGLTMQIFCAFALILKSLAVPTANRRKGKRNKKQATDESANLNLVLQRLFFCCIPKVRV